MPDLGQYATVVLSAYGIGIVLLLVLTVMSLIRGSKTKRELAALESGRKQDG